MYTNGEMIINSIACFSNDDLETTKKKNLFQMTLLVIAIKVNERKPRKLRIMFFGSPGAPSPLNKEGDPADMYQEHHVSLLQTVLSRYLKYGEVPYTLIRVTKENTANDASHLALELDEKQVMILLST